MALGWLVHLRPWRNGTQVGDPLPGVILCQIPGGYAVWFPTLGNPGDTGATQAYHPNEIGELEPLVAASPDFLTTAAHAMTTTHTRQTYPAVWEHVRAAYRAHTGKDPL